MNEHRFSAHMHIAAPPAAVYAILADYRHGHASILPRPYFSPLEVEAGGTGAGTIISFQMTLLGKVMSFRGLVDEPEPGRLLRETYEESGSVTTFLVEPDAGANACDVTITTATSVPDGILGSIQGWMTARLLRPIYMKELANLAAKATSATP